MTPYKFVAWVLDEWAFDRDEQVYLSDNNPARYKALDGLRKKLAGGGR